MHIHFSLQAEMKIDVSSKPKQKIVKRYIGNAAVEYFNQTIGETPAPAAEPEGKQAAAPAIGKAKV